MNGMNVGQARTVCMRGLKHSNNLVKLAIMVIVTFFESLNIICMLFQKLCEHLHQLCLCMLNSLHVVMESRELRLKFMDLLSRELIILWSELLPVVLASIEIIGAAVMVLVVISVC